MTFVYLKASSLIKLKSGVDNAWLATWKIENHPYCRLAGFQGNLEYAYTVRGRKTWCKFLVPYEIQFEPQTTTWEDVSDMKGWDGGRHVVTETNTARIMLQLELLN